MLSDFHLRARFHKKSQIEIFLKSFPNPSFNQSYYLIILLEIEGFRKNSGLKEILNLFFFFHETQARQFCENNAVDIYQNELKLTDTNKNSTRTHCLDLYITTMVAFILKFMTNEMIVSFRLLFPISRRYSSYGIYISQPFCCC